MTQEDVTKILIETALRDWPEIARGLHIRDCDIQAIQYNHARDLKRQCCEAVSEWWKSTDLSTKEKLGQLIRVLIEKQLMLTAGRCHWCAVFLFQIYQPGIP